MAKSGDADITNIIQAAETIEKYNKNAIVVLKSTVPVGTCRLVSKLLPKAKIASMPEFLREGYAMTDVLCPDRIIIGTPDKNVFNVLKGIYPATFAKKIHQVSQWESSELIKYASNAFLATKIHFANEIADLCEKVGANIKEVTKGMGLDKRIGDKFLNASVGYGGSCFPKDTNALYYLAQKHNVRLSLVNNTIRGNLFRQNYFADEINEAVKKLQSPRIAMLGLAFKEGTDDVRQSPAIHILERITLPVTVYDPKAMPNAQKILQKQDVTYSSSMADCINGANTIIVATEWKEFTDLDKYLKPRDNTGIVYDLKNILNKQAIEKKNYLYRGIGYGEK